ERCTWSTIAGDLVVVIAVKPQCKVLGEMLHEPPLDMKLGAGRVVRVGVFAIKGEAYGSGQFQADLRVEPRHSTGRVKGPTMDREISNAAVAPRTNRDV